MQELLQSLDIANYGDRINRIFKILRNCHHRKSSLIFTNTSNTICNFTRSRWSDRTAFQLVFAFESFQSRTLWTLAFDSSISQDAHCKMHSDEMPQPWASASFPLQNFGDSVVGVWSESPWWDSEVRLWRESAELSQNSLKWCPLNTAAQFEALRRLWSEIC